MIDALIAGRLCGTPQRRTAKNGSTFAVAKVRVATRDGGALFVSVISFSATAVQALLALEDGDSVALAGELTPKVWTDRDGVAKPQLDLLAHQVLTGYHVKRKREAVSKREAAHDASVDRAPDAGDGAAGAERPAPVDREFDDDIPF